MRLGKLRPLLDAAHDAWTPLRTRNPGTGPHVRTGLRALEVLLTPRSEWRPAQ
jgi:hypothetical protein